MNQEYEVKFLDIDLKDIEEKLIDIGAKKVGDYFYKRITFDFPGFPLHNNGSAWLRLRDEGDKVSLTWKKRLGVKTHDGKVNDEGMEEIEVIVSDFNKTASILRSIGMIDKFYQENKRTRWSKNNVKFDIDTWPLLNPYLEIEADSWTLVDEAIKELKLNPNDKKIFSTNQVYKLNGIDEIDYVKIAFDEMVRRSK